MNNNGPLIANNGNFKEKTIGLILDELEKKKIIETTSEKEELFKLYSKDSRDMNLIMNELQNLDRQQLMKKLNIKKKNEEEITNKISLENVKDFEKDGKNYILIHYPEPNNNIKVVENYSNKKAKDIFEENKDESGLVSIDGFVSSMDVYESPVEPDKTEVKMYNVTELAQSGRYNELSYEHQCMVLEVVKSVINNIDGLNDEQKKKLNQTPISDLVLMLNKNIHISPNEKIVIICTPGDNLKDEIKTVTKDQNGKFKLTSLNANGYDLVNGNNQTSNSDNSNDKEIFNNEENELGKNDYSKDNKGSTLIRKKPKIKQENKGN